MPIAPTFNSENTLYARPDINIDLLDFLNAKAHEAPHTKSHGTFTGQFGPIANNLCQKQAASLKNNAALEELNTDAQECPPTDTHGRFIGKYGANIKVQPH